MFRHVLLLPHLLPLDSMLQVQSPQASHGNAFIRESAVEEFGSPLEREACPVLKSLVARQEVNMVLIELGDLSVASWRSFRLQSMSTEVLDCVVGDAERLGDFEVRYIFV